jgi:hypothetical protein
MVEPVGSAVSVVTTAATVAVARAVGAADVAELPPRERGKVAVGVGGRGAVAGGIAEGAAVAEGLATAVGEDAAQIWAKVTGGGAAPALTEPAPQAQPSTSPAPRRRAVGPVCS